ncbi:MarR family winged helix-turn-helix transcriptional regulator [Nocardioides jensenii]|uniref:MarR family winged helix-turn-helix transcriptional regulator n=1 Tax=Nocardioides jensenii TaxID=1843 RepID=UPI0008327124|nr:MarR family winged helix-turn-helix transcriptional regulator [Nocardioides jensenii]
MGENTGDLLQAAARALRRRYGRAMAAWDIAPGQARALRLVRELDDPRLSVIAERLRIAARSATEVVDALESRGLVERSPDPRDRRATCVRVTETGDEMCVVIDRARAAAAKDYLSVLPAEDRAELDRLLRLLLEVHD